MEILSARKFSGKVDVFKKLQNCNYAVEISKQLKLSIGAINGENLARGETKPTLGKCLFESESHFYKCLILNESFA